MTVTRPDALGARGHGTPPGSELGLQFSVSQRPSLLGSGGSRGRQLLKCDKCKTGRRAGCLGPTLATGNRKRVSQLEANSSSPRRVGHEGVDGLVRANTFIRHKGGAVLPMSDLPRRSNVVMRQVPGLRVHPAPQTLMPSRPESQAGDDICQNPNDIFRVGEPSRLVTSASLSSAKPHG